MLKRTYDIVIDVVNGVTEKFIELIQASTGIRELAIKLIDGEDAFDVENKKIVEFRRFFSYTFKTAHTLHPSCFCDLNHFLSFFSFCVGSSISLRSIERPSH